MDVSHIILSLLLNGVALRYAVLAACVAAPLYALLLKPLVRWTRRQRHTAAAAAAATPLPAASVHAAGTHGTPVRRSTASSTRFLSPASAEATPLGATPVFHTSPARASSGTTATSAEPSLEVVGHAIPTATTTTATAAAAASSSSSTRGFVSALRRRVQQRGAAIFGHVDNDADALRAAVESGEVYQRCPPRQLPRQDDLAMRLLRRQQQHALYDELNCTEASLTALYASPRFQAWYGANRDELLRDAQLRESFYQWRSLARAAVLLMALVLLPAYSFSAATDAVQWRTSLTPASDKATVESAPFAQILLTRMRYIHGGRSVEAVAQRALPFLSYLRADLRTLAATAISMAEWLAIVTAVCSLVTSCFMPRGSRRTASIALAAFVVVVVESVLVPGVSASLGLGTLLIVMVVGTQIRRAAE